MTLNSREEGIILEIEPVSHHCCIEGNEQIKRRYDRATHCDGVLSGCIGVGHDRDGIVDFPLSETDRRYRSPFF